MNSEYNLKSVCRTEDSEGHDRIWAQIDLDAVLFNMESMRKNIREKTQIIAVLKSGAMRSPPLRRRRNSVKTEPVNRSSFWDMYFLTAMRTWQILRSGRPVSGKICLSSSRLPR